MRILVIGLGSMGKRRIRNLKALGITEIRGLDVREDRRIEANRKYDIRTYNKSKEALEDFKPDIAIISVPPDQHTNFIKMCINQIHCFIEASVTDKDEIFTLSMTAERSDLIIAPSCTMMYFPDHVR